jgi:hypothetical protein
MLKQKVACCVIFCNTVAKYTIFFQPKLVHPPLWLLSEENTGCFSADHRQITDTGLITHSTYQINDVMLEGLLNGQVASKSLHQYF